MMNSSQMYTICMILSQLKIILFSAQLHDTTKKMPDTEAGQCVWGPAGPAVCCRIHWGEPVTSVKKTIA